MPTTIERERRDWRLFSDWCESLGINSIPATPETIAGFLRDFPAPIEAQGRRVRAIRRAHDLAGAPLELPGTQAPTVWRAGPEAADVPRALAQLPTYRHRRGFQVALHGRRDGWLIVLVGQLGLTRQQARDLHQSQVTLFPSLTINGQEIPKSDAAAECPSCAVTRWLRVVGAASFGWWNEVKETVSPIGVDEAQHDCTIGLDGSWRQAATLLPAIDRHGWVSSAPLSTRAISTIIARRQEFGEIRGIESRPRRVATGRFADASMNELADAYEDVDQRAAALLLRLKEVVGEADDMLEHLRGFAP